MTVLFVVLIPAGGLAFLLAFGTFIGVTARGRAIQKRNVRKLDKLITSMRDVEAIGVFSIPFPFPLPLLPPSHFLANRI